MGGKRICVVTGGNKGIGFGIVKDLCKKFDGIVYLTSRDESRGNIAIEELKKQGLSPYYHQLDIDDKESVNRFADYIKTTYGGLDVLVNNAGIGFKNDATEPKGVHSVQNEQTIRTNYFSTGNMFRTFLPLLRNHARVVNVSSCMGHLLQVPDVELRARFSDHNLPEEKLDSLMNEYITLAKDGGWKEAGWPASTYAVSKVGLSALTRLQQKILDKDVRKDVVVNSCHPGYVDTDMTSHKGPLTIEEGAVCPVYLALLPSPTEHKGGFFWRDTTKVDWVNGPTPSAD